jgi:hypothetical protein
LNRGAIHFSLLALYGLGGKCLASIWFLTNQ